MRIQLSQWRYWLDFVLAPVIAFVLAAYSLRSLHWFIGCSLGILVWTFFEYAIHRALHSKRYWRYHRDHHFHPRELPMTLWWHAPVAVAVMSILFPLSFVCGVTIGYFWFIVLHQGSHHGGRLCKAAIARHIDHHRYDTIEYGVTTSLWDILFGTAKTSRRRP